MNQADKDRHRYGPVRVLPMRGEHPTVIQIVFAAGGLLALWCGVNWAFDVRGITTRRAERIRRKSQETWADMGRLGGPTTFYSSVGYLRFLGAVMAGAGLLLVVAAYALWRLG